MQALRQSASCRSGALRTGAGLSRRFNTVQARLITDPKSNASFPLAQRFWEGEEMHCLGSGTRVKKVLVVGVQVYSIAVYAEGERAAKELGIRARGGFFEGDGDYCAALLDGAFGKAVVFKLLRDISGQQFAEAIDEALGPRMKLTGEGGALADFSAFFSTRQLPKDTQIALVWPLAPPGHDVQLQGLVVPPGAGVDLETTAPQLRISSPGLARALFELYLGDGSIVPEGRAEWARGARALLESDEVKRATRKGGSG
ncbi:chalcone-flavanone isomerase [Raphidocelis subcapitata]|uniref:Chalcone-flavanone isomerase n=1 Tax=Raphidocelis subcapitata TaxID=307507 RepID=A0A2V0NTZ1_9CHLO|nr:chalcone-flavanone isomerase [Raphidocelis subcapitata]|eukprot:GBF91104.1 chalcone-flavanone isomerase [Raphidocelis subcapitata]